MAHIVDVENEQDPLNEERITSLRKKLADYAAGSYDAALSIDHDEATDLVQLIDLANGPYWLQVMEGFHIMPEKIQGIMDEVANSAMEGRTPILEGLHVSRLKSKCRECGHEEDPIQRPSDNGD